MEWLLRSIGPRLDRGERARDKVMAFTIPPEKLVGFEAAKGGSFLIYIAMQEKCFTPIPYPANGATICILVKTLPKITPLAQPRQTIILDKSARND